MPRRAIRANLGKVYAIRPVPRYIMFLGGTVGAVGAWLTGHNVIAVSALLVTAVLSAAELWIAKRRDDLFRTVVTQRRPDPDVLRALTTHEAVRSRLLSSEDAARLLRVETGTSHGVNADRKRALTTGTSLAASRSGRPGTQSPVQPCELSERVRPVDSAGTSACRDGDGQAGD